MTPTRIRQLAGGTLAAALCAATAAAQTSSAPAPQPVRPGVPGAVREELGIDRAPPMLREGTFVASARGVLAKGKTGRWYVIFDRDARGRQMPPMVILPSQYLAAMERIASRFETQEAETARTRVLITGQVMAYLGQNYLLPTAPPILETSAPSSAAPAAQPGEEPAKPSPDAAASDDPAAAQRKPEAEPSISQIIDDLDRALGTRRATNPVAATSTEQVLSEAGIARVRPAGFMTARRGRVVRAAAGEPTFIVDSGTAGEVAEPPMILLPCTNLTAIEALAERLGEAATFTMSGQVTVYRGRNYLLPTTYTVNRVSDQVIPNQ